MIDGKSRMNHRSSKIISIKWEKKMRMRIVGKEYEIFFLSFLDHRNYVSKLTIRSIHRKISMKEFWKKDNRFYFFSFFLFFLKRFSSRIWNTISAKLCTSYSLLFFSISLLFFLFPDFRETHLSYFLWTWRTYFVLFFFFFVFYALRFAFDFFTASKRTNIYMFIYMSNWKKKKEKTNEENPYTFLKNLFVKCVSRFFVFFLFDIILFFF